MEAIASYDRVIALHPQHAGAINNRGICELLCGRFRDGWRDYEQRWDRSDFPSKRPAIDAPLWRGEPLAEHRIVVYGEKGSGDIIQFVRYLPLGAAGRRGHVFVGRENAPPAAAAA